MKNSAQKALFALGFAGTLFSGLMASADSTQDVTTQRQEFTTVDQKNGQLSYTDITTRKEFTAIDQRNAKFVTIGKPFLVKHKPSLDEIDLIYCGWYDKENLENIVPTRFTAKFVDTNVKIDRVYQGYRETTTEQLIEGLLRAIKLYPHLTYEGTILVDEYLENIPMKWVFNNIDDFRAIKTYLIKKFAEKNVTIPQAKPLLLIDFIEKNQTFNEDDAMFLNTYYASLDPNNVNARAFFKELKLAMNVAREDTINAKSVLESQGEMFIRFAEEKVGSLKTKDLFTKFVLFAGACYLGTKLWAMFTDSATHLSSQPSSAQPART